MLKSVSKIAIVLFFTFLSGLVMTDCILPEIQAEERAEIEIEEEREIESTEEVETIFISKTITDEAGKKISIHHHSKIDLIEGIENSQYHLVLTSILNHFSQVNIFYNKLPKYILFGNLKLFS